jgi:hypothetical protein
MFTNIGFISTKVLSRLSVEDSNLCVLELAQAVSPRHGDCLGTFRLFVTFMFSGDGRIILIDTVRGMDTLSQSQCFPELRVLNY